MTCQRCTKPAAGAELCYACGCARQEALEAIDYARRAMIRLAELQRRLAVYRQDRLRSAPDGAP